MEILKKMSKEESLAYIYDWKFWARPKQMIPTVAFVIWLILSGRGWGKTRTGSEFIRDRVNNGAKRIALVGETKADVRDTMIEVEECSLLKTSPPWENLDYEPSKRRLVWYNNDNSIKSVGTIYSGDEPDQLRGPQHDTAWVDELAKFKYPQLAWDNLEFGMRKSSDPKYIVTTTPRPIKLIKTLVKDPDCYVTIGHTRENRSNLSANFIKRIYNKYHGTRIGRQELAGEILEDNPNALWTREKIEEHSVTSAPELKRIVVAVDPPGSEEGAECGIVAAGLGYNDHAYILDDSSLHAKPDVWGKMAVDVYTRLEADRIVAEINYGGDMVGHVINTVPGGKNASFSTIRATRGKTRRAEPVAALYEQGKVHHVGRFPVLEDQMCDWDPNVPDKDQDSPDRMDALVWALTELMLDDTPEFLIGKA